VDNAWTRYIQGPDGLLTASYESATGDIRMRLTNLHGDVIGIATGAAAPEILSTFETDEYGVPRDPDDIGDVRYGYLGQHERATDNPAGISLMGVRLYNAATGRFLQVDPVAGGNANPYVYPTDPITSMDLDGRMAKWIKMLILDVVDAALEWGAHIICNINLICSALLGAVTGAVVEYFDETWVDGGKACATCILEKAFVGFLKGFVPAAVGKVYAPYGKLIMNMRAKILSKIASKVPTSLRLRIATFLTIAYNVVMSAPK
jgi:RHS repeat-associated protein